ncbi:MAG: DegT/DnrJ/EryC1/StrS aminotransferase [Solirubrobacterales bacterium]|nr:DegT/DnrJ/EryC1/StrS aminotransferase [Solirubrobacterales bacterium]
MSDPSERPVPLFDVGSSFAAIREQALGDLDRLGAVGGFSLGPDLVAFEEEFAAYCGAAHCVGLSDGTVSLQLALQALGVGPGDEVVTTANTFVGTIEGIAGAGATPVLIDPDPDTRVMSADGLRAAITDRTAAIMPVHLYGRPVPIDEILAVAGSIPVVEDAAQAHGATLGGRRVGGFGTAAASFSFYPTKNLGALGDGGAVVCDDPAVAERLRSLRHHGSAAGNANEHVVMGGTHRLDNLQAAFLRHKLALLDADNASRRAGAALYRERLAGLSVGLPPEDAPGMEQVFHLFVVEVAERDAVIAALREAGIGAAVHYPTPVHLQPAWSHLAGGAGSLPVSERLAGTVLSLPCFPGITEEQVDRVCAALRTALGPAAG